MRQRPICRLSAALVSAHPVQFHSAQGARVVFGVILGTGVGGGLSNIDALYRRVPELWLPYIFSDDVRTKLLPPEHGDSSGVYGAAWLWEKT